jgi:diacylglycerol kinase (ATP)
MIRTPRTPRTPRVHHQVDDRAAWSAADAERMTGAAPPMPVRGFDAVMDRHAVRCRSGQPADRLRDVVVVVNTRSSRAAAAHEAVLSKLAADGVHVTAAHVITDPSAQLRPALADAVRRRPGMLLVGGGDGTVAAAVDLLAHNTGTVLGCLPLGTTNNFARTLGLPLRLAAALDVLRCGRVADIDVGLLDGRPFANMVSVGVSAAVASQTPAALKRRLGRAAYAATAARALRTAEPFLAEVHSGGLTWRVVTHQLNVANGAVHAGSRIAGDARVDDRLLVAYRLGSGTRSSTVRAAVRQAMTTRQPMAAKGYVVGSDLTITTDRPLPVDVDGELAGTTPIRVRVAPAALQVVVAHTRVAAWPPDGEASASPLCGSTTAGGSGELTPSGTAGWPAPARRPPTAAARPATGRAPRCPRRPRAASRPAGRPAAGGRPPASPPAAGPAGT